MPRTSVARQASALSMQDPWYSADLLPQIQSTLAALADIEVRYQSDQEQLRAWVGPEAEDTDEAVHFVQSEAVQAFRFQAVHGSEVKSST